MDDDFSDSEPHAHLQQSDEQDEQHTQKVNGQLELLLMKNKELSRDLKAEKAEVQHLTRELSLAKLELGQAPSISGAGSSSSGALGGTYLSSELKHEMMAFYEAHKESGLGVASIHDISAATDEACIALLKSASKLITKSSTAKPSTRGTTAGSAKQSEKEQVLIVRIKDLESELKLALGAAEDIRALKTKLLQLVERVRLEKEGKMKADAELALTNKKMHMLADHLEKLMTHLKHEAAAKIRAVEQLRVGDKEMARVKEKSELISRKSAAKDRLVLELREGCKILEDQLRLMDEKYLELRTKLDWARENSEKKVRAAVAKAKELRVKFALMGNTTPLDKIQLPLLDTPYNGGSSVNSLEYDAVMSQVSRHGHSAQAERLLISDRGRMAPGRKMSGGSVGSLDSRKEADLDHVLDKIRKKTGGKVDWDEDKLRNLAKSR